MPRRVLPMLIALAAVLSGCGDSSHHVPRALPTRTGALISIIEADPQLHADPAGTLDQMRSLGADTVRVFMPWGSLGSLHGIAPSSGARIPPVGFRGSDPAAYPAANWAVFDAIIRQARARGLAVDLTLGPPPPLWAQGPGDPGHPVHPQWRPDANLFGQFVRAVGTRYSGNYRPAGAPTPLPRVNFWAIWNEPNFGPMIAPQVLPGTNIAASPPIYRAMLDSAWSALGGTGHGHDRILIGELAPRGVSLGHGPGPFGYMVPLRFLRGLYCVDSSLRPLRGATATTLACPPTGAPRAFLAAHPGLFRAAGFALHPYEFTTPNLPTPGEPDYADLASIGHFEQTIDSVAAAYGVRVNYPIYSTEFGFETNPPEKVFGTVTPDLAAEYMNFAEYISWRDRQVRSYDQYLLLDPAAANFATGLRFADGRAKPGLAAYRLPLFLPRQDFHTGQAIEVWGRVRPARYAGSNARSQFVEIQFRRTGATAFATVARIRLGRPSFTFDVRQSFAGGGSVRLAWNPPSGPTIFSRTATISSR